MPTLQLKINNKFFNIACDEGQEHDLKKAAENLNQRLGSIYKMLPNATPDLALVVTALMMQDELSEKDIKDSNYAPINFKNEEKIVSDTLDSITNYIEELASNLEKC
jgi:cell division protein ZapA